MPAYDPKTLKASAGQIQQPNLRFQNRLTEVERQIQEVGRGFQKLRQQSIRDSQTVKIFNSTGETIPRYAGIELGDARILPADNEQAFKDWPTFEALKPSKNSAENIAISLSTIADQEPGWAVAIGVVAARVDLKSDADRMCNLVQNSFELDSTSEGQAEIIFHPGWASMQTGVDWAQIRIGGAAGGGGATGYPARTTTEITARPNPQDQGSGEATIYRYDSASSDKLDEWLIGETIFSNWSIAIPINTWIWVQLHPSVRDGDVWFIVSEDCQGGTIQSAATAT